MRIAGIQMSAGPEMAKNLGHALDIVEMAAQKGARIIGFPELCCSPWFLAGEDRTRFSLASGIAGELIRAFEAPSRKHGIVIVLPFFETHDNAYYNSAAVIDNGTVLGVYRKVHLHDLPLYRERFYFSTGDTRFPVFATSQGKIGVQICWDNLFPEGSRILALKGAEIVFAPTAASQDGQSHWERAIAANAFANNLFVFRVNRVGHEGRLAFTGRSFCADPWGEMVSELAGSKEAIVLADIDLAERAAAADTWGFLKHRRPAEYGDLLQP